MKKNKIVTVIMMAFLITIPVLSKNIPDKKELRETKLDGIWIFKGQSINGSGFMPSTSGIYKSILNGKFISFQPKQGGATITGQGDIEIQSDSVLIEKVQRSLNSTLNSKENKMVYKLKDNKYLSVRYLLEKNSLNNVVNHRYEEVWEKQEIPRKSVGNSTSLMESKSLVGIWNQIFPRKMENGEMQINTSGNYKVINPDNTFYSFVTWPNRPVTVGMYGTYKINSDSTCTEHITKHGLNPKMSGTDSQIRYKFIDANTVYIMYNNNGTWIPEMFKRTLLHDAGTAFGN